MIIKTNQSIGTLYGVGVGPGDPELLTLKAVRIINECTHIAIPASNKETCVSYQIAVQAVPSISEKECIFIPMPMIKDKNLLEKSHMAGAKKLIDQLDLGYSIAFLTLGDPTVYSTFLYLQNILNKQHYSTVIISGIPSFCAAAASLNIGLAEKSEPLHIYPGSYPIEESLSLSGTKIYMKSGRQMTAVRDALKKHHKDALMVENCGMPDENKYYHLESIPANPSYYSLLIEKGDTP